MIPWIMKQLCDKSRRNFMFCLYFLFFPALEELQKSINPTKCVWIIIIENEMSIFAKYKNSHHVHIGMKCLKSNEV